MNTNDSGAGSLRQAILDANAAAGADTINFQAGLTGTITSTTTIMAINGPVTINGPGAGILSISGANTRTIFNTAGTAAGQPIQISGLTLTAGRTATGGNGGAIFANDETLILTNCSITGSTATRGGAISFAGYGSLTLDTCTISGNTASGRGGAVYFTYGGQFNIRNTTISGNSSGNRGGGLFLGGTATGPLLVSNSTFSGNSAAEGGGIMLFGFSATLAVQNSTFTANSANSTGGGGIALISAVGPASVALESTIISGNTGTDGPDISTTLFSGLTAKNCAIGSATGFTMTDLGGNLPFGSDLKLGALANNGGSTLTHALLAGSPAIDAGDPAAIAGVGGVPQFDQRGAPFFRVFDGNGSAGVRIDVGAFEARPLTLVVDTLVDEDDGNFTAGDLSLREAISLANGFSGTETISFASALTSGGPATLLLTLGQLVVRDIMSIQGPGAELLTIDASGNDPTPALNNGDGSRVFEINNFLGTHIGVISISGLTLTGGDVAQNGGAISNVELLQVRNVVISGNSAGGVGGAIFSDRLLGVVDSTISGNSASSGGGIYSFESLQILDSTISGNTVSSGSGGIRTSGTTTISSSTISGNTAMRVGGINNNNGTMTVTNCTVSGNSASDEFGGIFTAGNTTLRHSTITLNRGGGVDVFQSSPPAVLLDHTIVAGNTESGGTLLRDLTGIATLAFSFLGDNTDATITDNGGNQFGIAGMPIDPLLGPLADNGGPTLTHMLLMGSPAIEAGNPAAVAGVGNVPGFDQRGNPFARVFGGRIDLGAVEFFSTAPFASAATANVTSAGGTIQTITVQYFDAVGINTTTLGNSDITVNGPGGPIPVIFTGFTGGGTLVSANYTMVPPGGSWDTADTGTYSIAMRANEVFDTDAVPNSAPAGTFDSFSVFIPFDPVVSITDDENDGNFEANDLSLREAVILANVFAGMQTIAFDPTVFATPRTIALQSSLGQISVGDSLNLNGPLAGVTLDAGGASRHFQLTAISVALSNLNFINGDSHGGDGGSVFMSSPGSLTITNCTFSNNTASGLSTSGGGGGAIASYGATVALTNCTVSGNTSSFQGGGVFARNGAVTIRNTTISNNTGLRGGGFLSQGAVTFTLENSTVSGNSATETTVSGRGGGLGFFGFAVAGGSVTIRHSTITDNTSLGLTGGGIHASPTSTNPITIESSIISGNTHSPTDAAAQFSPDFYGPTNTSTSGAWNVTISNSLIGVKNAFVDIKSGTGNLTGTEASPLDAKLGPLAANGGPTKTHALLTGSPAIDAGDPNFDPADPDGDPMTDDAVSYDQRGAPFTRAFDGDGAGGARIDIGAFEFIPDDAVHALFGDYNRNGVVDSADYTVWRDTLTVNVIPFSGADGDGDATIDQDDYSVWRAHFGQTVPVLGAGSAGTQTEASALVAPEQVDPLSSFAATSLSNRPPTEPRAGGRVRVADGHWRAASPGDQALMAWLAAQNDHRPSGEPIDVAGPTVDDAADSPISSLDAVFEQLGVPC